MSDHRLKGDLAVMYQVFLNWKAAQPRFFIVYWYWKQSCIDSSNWYWSADIFHGIGHPKRIGNTIHAMSIMGGAHNFSVKNCKIFYNKKDAQKFCQAKRRELNSLPNLFS